MSGFSVYLPEHQTQDMSRLIVPIKYFLLAITVQMMLSCNTAIPKLDYRDIVRAAVRLEMDIDVNDYHPLYVESAKWIGVPYRYNGNSKSGVDCSGLTCSIYKEVYHKTLSRNSEEQRTKDCRRISKRKLREGDLVFFHDGKKKKKASHVGIYLKDNKFIHASIGRGVIVSSLNEPAYKKNWMGGGRITKHL